LLILILLIILFGNGAVNVEIRGSRRADKITKGAIGFPSHSLMPQMSVLPTQMLHSFGTVILHRKRKTCTFLLILKSNIGAGLQHIHRYGTLAKGSRIRFLPFAARIAKLPEICAFHTIVLLNTVHTSAYARCSNWRGCPEIKVKTSLKPVPLPSPHSSFTPN